MKDYCLDNRNYYLPAAKEQRVDFNTVKWGSRESQFLRFNILSEIHKDFFTSSILDIGCGVGHLVDFIKENHYSGEYLGLDLLEEMTTIATQRHPKYNFICGDIGCLSDKKFDFVVASGIFTLANLSIAEMMLREMYARCTTGVAVNFLSALATQKQEDEFFADPAEIIAICRKLTSKFILRHDYLAHDFTMYLYV